MKGIVMLRTGTFLLGLGLVLVMAATGLAEPVSGLDEQLEQAGIEVGLGVTQIYQTNVRGGASTTAHRGRYTGSYDLEMWLDMDRMLGWQGWTVFAHAEGSWPDEEGIDGAAVGSFFGVNADAGGDRAMDLTELWMQKDFGNGLLVRAGKIDLTGGFECSGCPVAFDSSMYANDETSQFLNAALVNNPTIPFVDYGQAAAIFYSPVPRFYVSGAVQDAQADARETGFNTAFHGADYFFYIFETGLVPEFASKHGPLLGAYRLGFWLDPQDKQRFNNANSIKRDDHGVYLSCDQQLFVAADGSEEIGLFGRYGWTDSEVEPAVTNFYSAGVSWRGIFEGREEDVLAFGYAHGTFTDKDKVNFPEGYESVFEVYYSVRLTESAAFTPSLQYVTNPGAATGVSDAVVLAGRLQLDF